MLLVTGCHVIVLSFIVIDTVFTQMQDAVCPWNLVLTYVRLSQICIQGAELYHAKLDHSELDHASQTMAYIATSCEICALLGYYV